MFSILKNKYRVVSVNFVYSEYGEVRIEEVD